jgi:hypothetical protein
LRFHLLPDLSKATNVALLPLSLLKTTKSWFMVSKLFEDCLISSKAVCFAFCGIWACAERENIPRMHNISSFFNIDGFEI